MKFRFLLLQRTSQTPTVMLLKKYLERIQGKKIMSFEKLMIKRFKSSKHKMRPKFRKVRIFRKV